MWKLRKVVDRTKKQNKIRNERSSIELNIIEKAEITRKLKRQGEPKGRYKENDTR